MAGPHSLDEIQEMFAMGALTTQTPVVRAGEKDWQTLGAYCDLNELKYQPSGIDSKNFTETQSIHSIKAKSSGLPVKSLLLLGILISSSVVEIWTNGIGLNPLITTIPRILGRSAAPLFIGAIGGLFAKNENFWSVLFTIAYLALFASAYAELYHLQ